WPRARRRRGPDGTRPRHVAADRHSARSDPDQELPHQGHDGRAEHGAQVVEGDSLPLVGLPQVGAQLAGADALATTVVGLAERGLERLQQLVRRAADRLLDALGLVRHRDRLAARDAGLEHAPYVLGPGLAAAVVVAHMGFDPRDLLAEPAHGGSDRGFDIVLQIACAQVAVRPNEYLHGLHYP